MNQNDVMISLYNDDGSMKSKDDFLNDVGDFYDIAAHECKEQEETGLLQLLSNPENQIEPEVVIANYEFLTRAIYITTDITPELAGDVVKQIKMWNGMDKADSIPPEERQPIYVYIDTPGGDITATFSIISAIQISKTPVYTITYGCGYSGGFFIGICGHKKFGTPYSSYLFHEGGMLDGGDAHKFIQHVEFYKLQLNQLKNITIEHTKISSDDYESKKKDDWFFTANEALHYGIIDEILTEF